MGKFFSIDNLDYARKVPYVPSSYDSVTTITQLAQKAKENTKKSIKAADLGSGDGRIIVSLAEHDIESHGYEIDGKLALTAEQKILEKGLDGKAFIHPVDYWKENLSDYDIVIIYGMNSVMEKLEKKLAKELKPEAKVISNVFQFPHWKAEKEVNHIFLYSPRG